MKKNLKQLSFTLNVLQVHKFLNLKSDTNKFESVK